LLLQLSPFLLAFDIMPKEEVSFQAWATDFCLGGVAGAVSKTFTAPIERVKLLIQTQDANPLIRSGEVKRYAGIVDCFSRISSEQGVSAFWRGNTTNCIRYFPTQAFNLSFKDTFKNMFPKYSPKTEFGMFFAVNMASGGMAAAGSLCIVYPLDYARTRLASDVGGGKKTFNGLVDCVKKTAAGPLGPAGLYAGFGVSLMGIIPYRGFQLGAFDTLCGLNPYKDDKGMIGLVTTFASAQSAIIAGAGISYPFDTVRRRLQMQAELPKEKHIYNGTIDCLKKIAAEEGIAAGVYKGFIANAFRSVGAALVLVLYDRGKKMLAENNAK
jgi:solute carrier family 25 (adenine nucleotide translocator) protein 4/5/6/31